jgi:hypothetical protein
MFLVRLAYTKYQTSEQANLAIRSHTRVSCQVSAKVSIPVVVFWVVTPCSPLDGTHISKEFIAFLFRIEFNVPWFKAPVA